MGAWVRNPSPRKIKPRDRPPTPCGGRARLHCAVLGPGRCAARAKCWVSSPARPAARLFGFESSPVQLCQFLPEQLCMGHLRDVEGGSWGARSASLHCLGSQLQKDGRDGRGWWRSAGASGREEEVSGLAGATLPAARAVNDNHHHNGLQTRQLTHTLSKTQGKKSAFSACLERTGHLCRPVL